MEQVYFNYSNYPSMEYLEVYKDRFYAQNSSIGWQKQGKPKLEQKNKHIHLSQSSDERPTLGIQEGLRKNKIEI